MSVRLEKDYSQQTKNVKIAMNKSLLKEFRQDNERVVYLENGNEFQIQIFNDQTTEIGAKIYVNGEMIGNSYLVIRPGERVWLDRYLDKARKFKFSTYEVNGNNKDVKKAIEKNGLVKVELFRKTQYATIADNWRWTPPILKTCEPDYAPQIYYCNEPYSTCKTIGLNSFAPDNNETLSFCESTLYSAASGLMDIKCNVNKMETGRIQEGNHSDQEFEYVNMSFEMWPFDTEEIHILPKSVKPVYSNELQKSYCHNCGRKLKSKFNFCPFCGAKQ